MKTILMAGACAAALGLALPAAAQSSATDAQSQQQPAATDTGAPTPSGADAQTAAKPAGEADIVTAGGLVAAISNLDTEMKQLSGMSGIKADAVTVVSAEKAIESAEAKVIKDEIKENQAQINKLRQELGNNDAIKSALDAQKASMQDVIAIDVLDDGKVMVFTHKG